MIIRHVDRTGTPWVFQLDCSPIQGQIFERLLTSVRAIGNREELNLSYLAEWEENTAFRNTLEHVVLSALRDWTAPPTPARVSETVNVNPSTVNTNTNEEPDEREPYYWELF